MELITIPNKYTEYSEALELPHAKKWILKNPPAFIKDDALQTIFRYTSTNEINNDIVVNTDLAVFCPQKKLSNLQYTCNK